VTVTDYKPVPIISDQPAEDQQVAFGFEAYSRTLSAVIANKDNKTPLVIGIYGPWGSGKTTLMKSIIADLKNINDQSLEAFRKCKTIWFQAWKHGNEDEILAALIEEILKTMKQDGFLENCKAKVEELIERFNVSRFFGELTKKIVKVDITEFFETLPHKERLGFYDSFQSFFDQLIWTYLNWRPQVCADEKTDDREAALVIFIDDLDRCPRDRIPYVLETVKLFMDREGCIFVIGAANEIIENSLKIKYGEEDASKFMDKIVQVTFNLPQILREDFESFLDQIGIQEKGAIMPHLPLIISAVKSNPRRLKRFLNNLNLLEGILVNKKLDVDYKNVLFWSIIDYLRPDLREDLKDNPGILEELKKHVNRLKDKIGDTAGWDIPAEDIENIPASFHKYLKDKELGDLLNGFDITPDQLRQLSSLSGIVESAVDVKEKREEARDVLDEFDKMAEIPAGQFIYQDGKDTIKNPYLIDVYPVTNRQYEQFIKAGGYRNEDYWSSEGKDWLKKVNEDKPIYWHDEKWNQPEHPLVGVSYFEAEAYAEWARKRLPTEKEWERAARGIDGSEYPWGNKFDKEKCNTKESGIRKTTRVTRYPNGRSSEGCYDMAGNVWEWTSSFYDKKRDSKVLRGGSWNDDQDDARCADRDGGSPSFRDFFMGFRCVRDK
jgi:iron(II)-dependent oxidoreductase